MRGVTWKKKSKRPLIGLFLLLIAVVVTAAGCGGAAPADTKPAAGTGDAGGGQSKAPSVLRIGYQKGNTLNILKVKGNLEERLKSRNIKVEWKVFPGGSQVLEALAVGGLDFGHAADGSGVFAQAGGQQIVYVGSDLPNPEGMGLMVHQDSAVKTIPDLKGKKIAVIKGGNHHYLTVLAVEKAGLQLSDIQLVFVKDASEGRALFETKQVDALGSWDPFFATVQNDLKPVTLTDGSGYSPNRTFYYANPAFAKEHPDLVKTVLEETNKSDEWANTNKAEVIKLLTAELGIDQKAIESAVNRRTYGVENLTADIIAPQQQLADTFHRIGLIDKQVKVADIMPLQAAWKAELPAAGK